LSFGNSIYRDGTKSWEKNQRVKAAMELVKSDVELLNCYLEKTVPDYFGVAMDIGGDDSVQEDPPPVAQRQPQVAAVPNPRPQHYQQHQVYHQHRPYVWRANQYSYGHFHCIDHAQPFPRSMPELAILLSIGLLLVLSTDYP
jgi:5-methylcytosine-specific restriction endonuclease McrA